MSDLTILAVRGRGTRGYSPEQQLLVSKQGEDPPALITATAVEVGDFIGTTYGRDLPDTAPVVPRLPERRLRGTEKRIDVPARLTEELAFFLGAYMAEGHRNRSNWTVVITNSVIEVLERVQSDCRAAFGLEGQIVRQHGKCPGFVVASKRLVELLDLLGSGSRASNKRVPGIIKESTHEHVLAFLQGVALDAYTCCRGLPRWAICLDSAAGINELQDLVTSLGIPNSQIAKWNGKYEKYYFELYMSGRAGQEFSRLVQFLEPEKRERALQFRQMELNGADWTDVVPGVRGAELYELIPRGRGGRGGAGTGRQRFRHLCDSRTRHVTRVSVLRAESAGAELPSWLARLVTSNVRFSPVLATGPDALRLPLATARGPRRLGAR